MKTKVECPECGEENHVGVAFSNSTCFVCEAALFLHPEGYTYRGAFSKRLAERVGFLGIPALTEPHWRYGEETIEEEII